ncbi:sodium:proton antiporter [Sporanaerobium hydrogeniformans]|uniref:Sodium:proton antiporter n=1 Tax=Sporanaerobium hydrogeniformans TaxID=3072179 RepID=A0AC61DGQ5_9FIRM|nr:Na+/H+ antiporter NhaC family protein [Sporanaerobium hydrogeniformans]PHV72055.1 sodium:proton antiporter [Sporanaerobium hydrogeniformans]
MQKAIKKGNPLALLPLGVFLILFVGTGIVTGDFYKMPVLVAFMIAAASAFILGRKQSLNEKINLFCKGAGDSNIILMCMIFLLAGAFSNIAEAMGGVEATVNLSLSLIPPNLLVGGIFLIACFISISMGTSVGTITALASIGAGIAQMTGISLPLILGAIVGGGMFGDNLSMISDTTITAVRTQGCELKDKFKVNFFIVLPAAVVTLLLLIIMTGQYESIETEKYSYELIKVVPYVAILIGALAGLNVFVLLGGGTLFAGLIGVFTGSFTVFEGIEAVAAGIMGMSEIALLSIIIGGTLALIKENGGIDYVLYFITSRIKSKKGAELGIAALVGAVDVCTANNTIAIVMAGPLAKDIAEQYAIDPRRSASILDIFSACFQGIIPYGAQLLVAAGLGGISPMEILRYLHYPLLMGLCGILAIVFGFPNLKPKEKNYT